MCSQRAQKINLNPTLELHFFKYTENQRFSVLYPTSEFGIEMPYYIQLV